MTLIELSDWALRNNYQLQIIFSPQVINMRLSGSYHDPTTANIPKVLSVEAMLSREFVHIVNFDPFSSTLDNLVSQLYHAAKQQGYERMT